MSFLAGIGWSPLVPGLWLGILAALAVAVGGLGVWRGARGAWLRLIPLVMLLVALANPRLVAEDRQPLPDIALVVVDDSPSQGIGDRRAETEAALATVTGRLARQPNLEVRTERVRGGAGDDGTRLFAAIERALADVPRRRLAGVVMITDGRIHDVPADKAASLGAPLHGLITGRPGERDRRLVVTQSPGFALVGKTAAIKLKVEDVGATGSAQVEIKVDGKPYLAAPVPLNREASIEVPVRHAGTTVIELAAADSPAGELSLANNRTALGISGVRDRLKVLLISGEPHAGERTWRNLLKADPAVDLVHFTILRPPEKDDRTPIRELALITFPVRELFEEKLADFDLVVFDRYRRRGVLAGGYYELLAQYVRQGGALLMAVGPEFAEADGLAGTGLASILPALPTGEVLGQAFRPLVTEIGRRHPVTSALPGGEGGQPRWGSWMRQVAVRGDRGTSVLAGIGGRPLVVLDKVGDGRVAQVLSDTIWLWSRGFEGGGPHDELLRRLAHWLMKEPELEEEALSAELKGDRLEVLRRSLQPAPASVTVTRPDGSTLALPLDDHGDGSATATLAVDQPGLWRVEDGALTAIAAAGSLAPVELAELAATPDMLAPVAEATGGSVRFLAQGGVPDLRRVGSGRIAAGRDWIGLAARGDHVVSGVREVPLAPGAMVLLLALGGLMAAWKREGR